MAKSSGSGGEAKGAVTPVLASLNAMKLQFDSTTATMEKFVAALSPASVMQFEQAIQNIHATIGQALQPALQILTDALQNAAAIIDPAMKALAPTIQKVGEYVGKLISVFATVFETLIQVLQPVIDIIYEFTNAIADTYRVLAVLVKTLVEVISVALKPFGDMIKSVINLVVGAFKELIKAVIFTAAGLAKMLGAGEFLGKMIANLEKIQNAGRVQNAAPQSVAIQDWRSIAEEAAKSSVQAGGAVPAKTQEELMTEIIAGLKDIESGRKEFHEVITASIEAWWGKAWNQIREAWGQLITAIGKLNPF